MARDPLVALARLRRLETTEATRRLGDAFHRLDTADRRVAAAAASLTGEAAAGIPSDYATWLRRGLTERDRAGIARGLAEAGTATAQAHLAEANAAERALDQLREAKLRAARQHEARRAQAALDEVTRRPDMKKPRPSPHRGESPGVEDAVVV